MGLLDKVFGKRKTPDEVRREELLDALKAATGTPPSCSGCLARARNCLGPGDSPDLRMEAVNALFEWDRAPYAEALALDLLDDPTVPGGIAKGILKHFLREGRADEVQEQLAGFVRRFPEETELAEVAVDAAARRGDEDLVLELCATGTRSNNEARRLYAAAGQVHARRGEWEDALAQLRPACELFERAFRGGQVGPDEINGAQLEYQHAYNLLERAAREQLGDAWSSAFEDIVMDPSSFGVAREAEKLAAERPDYRPAYVELPSQDRLLDEAEGLGDDPETLPRRALLEGMAALRDAQSSKAIEHFRAELELDLDAFGAYWGWAAADRMDRQPPWQPPGWEAWPTDQRDALAAVFPDWPAMTGREKDLAAASAAPVRHLLGELAAAGAGLRIHPLDVRLADIYPERVELRFEGDASRPQSLGRFGTGKQAHVRLDVFLTPGSEAFGAARELGFLLAEVCGSRLQARAEKAQAQLLDARGRPPRSWRAVVADTLEARAIEMLFGEDAASEKRDLLVAAGAWTMIDA